MTFELVYSLRSEEKTVLGPKTDDILEAYRSIRHGHCEVANLENTRTGALLQLVSFDGGENVCVALFPDEDGSQTLYSESDSLTGFEVAAICEAFMTSGSVEGIGIPFNDKNWWERSSSSEPMPMPEANVGTSGDPDEEVEEEDDPQDILNCWMQDSGHCDEDLIRWALESGATFSAFTPIPPLIYIAQHGATSDAADFLLSYGEDIGTVHDGGTAVWHAVSNSNYVFADELLLRGAKKEEAQSSKNFERWKKRDRRIQTLDAIAAGNERAVEEYLKGRPAKNVSIDLLTHAIASEQLAILKRLLEHKGKATVTSPLRGSVWGLAMAKSDVRYLQALIEHGGYESVSALSDYGGIEFVLASPEALSFLFSNGYTAGFQKGFFAVINRNRRSARYLLPNFPNEYFTGLTPQQLTTAVLSFEQFAPERTDIILDQNDFASLVRFIFHEADSETAYYAAPRIFGISVSGPKEHFLPSYRMDNYVGELRNELRDVAAALL